MSNSSRPHGLQHARLFCPWIFRSWLNFMSPESMMVSNDLILYYSFSSCPQSFPASGSFLVSWVFTSGGQKIRASASISPYNKHSGLIPLGLTDSITLFSEGLSKVFSSITIEKHQFFSIQLSLWSNSLIHIHDYWKNHSFNSMDLCQQSDFFSF